MSGFHLDTQLLHACPMFYHLFYYIMERGWRMYGNYLLKKGGFRNVATTMYRYQVSLFIQTSHICFEKGTNNLILDMDENQDLSYLLIFFALFSLPLLVAYLPTYLPACLPAFLLVLDHGRSPMVGEGGEEIEGVVRGIL
ncbi:hypothetical protein DL98DRAFT_122646 [Cadophora sp. DSE1049]|nr:hypothetical protein DL98DRAFT_122646 [Cadophora sp. DSE1049]